MQLFWLFGNWTAEGILIQKIRDWRCQCVISSIASQEGDRLLDCRCLVNGILKQWRRLHMRVVSDHINKGLVGVISLISFIALTWYVFHRNGTNTRLLGQAVKACVVTVKILCCRAEHVLLQKLSNHQCKASTVLASETAFKHSPFRCVCKLKFSWRCRKQFHCACWFDILVVSGCAHAHAVWSACHHRLLQVAPFVQYNADWPGLYQI